MQTKMRVKFKNSPGARHDRRGLGLNGEWPPRISSSFLEGHAPLAPFVNVNSGVCAAAKTPPATPASWLDQKVRHGLELLLGLTRSAHYAAPRVLGDLEFHARLLREPGIEPVEQRAAARQINTRIADIGGEFRRDIG